MSYIGGLCGLSYGTIIFCYATGAVSGNSYVGGLCGENYAGWITSCYATGAVSGNSYVGGLCGENYAGMISSSFWDTDTSDMTTSAGGTGKTTAQMKDVNTFLNAGWDFAVTDYTPAVWYMPEGDYPGLTCQLSVEVADVTGLPLTEIAAPLIQTWPGLNVVLSVEASDTIAEGHVIRQMPSPGSLLPGNSIVSVVIAGKPLGYAGSGVPGAPYQIDTPSDWLWLVQTPSDWSKQFVLTADLDFGGGTITPVAPNTSLSSYGFQGTAFTGVFDGGGHVLRNFVINRPDSNHVGLFGRVGSGGKIMNLGADPLQVTGRKYVGGLCGENLFGTITSCYATGAVSGDSSVGGLCGENYAGTITSCYATGAVTGTGSNIGGLCGENSYGTITSCYATGAVSGDSYVGGLCGGNNCLINTCYATGAVSGYSSVGGLCGLNYASIISDSFWDTDTSGRTTSAGGTGKTTAQMKDINTFLNAGWDFTVTDNTPAVWYMPGSDYPGLTCQLSVEVADVTGLPLTEIAAPLIQTWPGLNVALFIEASDTIAEGHVIRQTPSPGSLLPGNSIVSVVIAGKPLGYAGSGVPEAPYQIDTPSDWLWLIQTPSDWSKQFVLTADLDFGGGTITPVASFTGVFDGGSHVLRNFVINQPASDYVGLFGQVGNGGQVMNLGAEPLQVTGRRYVGGLCGWNYEGTITSCYTTGAVSGDSSVGGLCGLNESTITSCYATGAVTGTGSNVGGLCGTNKDRITSCYATGAVSGTGSSVGGLCGGNYEGMISGCFWDTDTSGVTTSDGGTGKTTAQMKDINTFLNAGWDFTVTDNTPAVWYMPEGDYPGLACYLSVEVADVTGLPLTEAAVQLIQTWPGLNVALFIEASDTIAEGHVIRQTPSPGSLLPGNSIVSVVIAGKPLGYAGSGVPEAPYQIDTPSDWLWLIQTPSDWSKRFVLTADLDFGGGTITPVASFTGVFDGGSHVLRNYVINQPASDYVGLFGQVGNGGQVMNLGAEPLQVTGRQCVGGLCGWNYEGTITSCYTTGAVSGTDFVGGLCGWNYEGTITFCYATGAVSGASDVGGLCGGNYYGTITFCYATGAVSGTSSAGGLCGYGGTITSCYATGAVSGDRRVGGLCGYGGTITLCYATGVVTGTSDVGGLCGYNSGTISGCFWDINASGMTTSAGGTGKTTAQMKDVNTFLNAGWDFAVTDYTPAVWYMPEGDYPGLTCYLSVEVADVTGLPLTEAAAQLIQTWPGLNVVLSVEASDTIAEGHVIRQTPSPGSLLPGSSIVSVAIAGKPSGYAGSGVPEAPYQIDTPSDWLWLIQTPSDWGKQFVLAADLDFGGGIITPVAPDTDPSSSGFQGTAFTGVFDGGGHVLRNFVINRPARDYVGLFGQVGSGGQVRNLGVEPLRVTGRLYVGGLCGYNKEGTITSCYATGAVNGYWNVGGLCGENYSSGKITSCYATGAVSGTESVGGLCGVNWSTISGSFWDIQTSGMTTSAGGTGKTTAEMQTLSTFTSAGWDFSTVWKMLRENEDYPRLIWQEEFAGDIAGLYGVDLIDLSYLSRHWGLVDCGGADDCGRADIDSSGDVGIGDLLHIANDWLKR